MQAWEEELIYREESRREGLEAGRREGLETGRREGLETGRREGLETGRQDTLKKIVQNLIQENMPDSKIIKLTGCTQAVIDDVRFSYYPAKDN